MLSAPTVDRPAVPAILLRLLLCLSVLVSGTGATAAGAHALVASAQVAAIAETAGPATADDRGDCGHHADAPALPSPPADGGGDCMQRCLDLWLQQGQALLAWAPSLAAVPATLPLPPSIAPGWPQRAGDPPVRPPIA